MDPDDSTESRPVRPSLPTIEANASKLKPKLEQRILNEILFDSFGYVRKNGYLGQNKIINYELENNASRYRAPLSIPRSFEPNHGVTALLPQLSSQQEPIAIQGWLRKKQREDLIWKAAVSDSVQSKSALPDDINLQAPSHCLRHWEKPNFMNFEINTHLKLQPAIYGDGSDMNRLGMRSTYDTWRSPLQPGEPIRVPGLPNPEVQFQVRQHNFVHY
jgi:hypothetical protein